MEHKEKIKNLRKYKVLRKNLRNNLTDAERKLWKEIRNSQINGLKFRRQYGIDRYILDFYCPKKKLAIEVDGGQHFKEIKKYDLDRDKFLRQREITVVRFWNNEIFNNLEGVLFKIREELGLEN